MKKIVTMCLLTIMLTGGCHHTRVKQLTATGGSKADGIVELSYEYKERERYVVNLKQGNAVAAQRCRAWGYADAEAFGGKKTRCIIQGGKTGCREREVTMQYQCTGTRSTTTQPRGTITQTISF